MANKKKSKDASPPKAPEVKDPSLLVRVVGDQFWNLLIFAGGLSFICGWIMRDTHAAGRPIPTPMYVYLAAGLILGAALGLVRWLRADELETVWKRRRALKEARALLKEVRRGKKRYSHRLDERKTAELEAAEKGLETARTESDWSKLGDAINVLDAKLDEHLSFARKSTAREYVESIAVAVLIALLLRSFVVEAFRIPSGSMIPTLEVGDHIFVNKFIYGVRVPWTDYKFGMTIRKPQRGEVIVFKYPKDPEKDFIKRIVAVEGDTIEVKQNVLYINGQKTEHTDLGPREYEDTKEESNEWVHHFAQAFRENLGGNAFTVIQEHDQMDPTKQGEPTIFAEVRVPPAHVFVMGDNRNNSHDSRYWGFVPYELIKGKAMIIWWSSGQPEGIRIKRMGRLVD